MENQKILKLSSISKKLVVALLGGFLLIFLLLHMSANLCILRHDDGIWYSDFCHFFGTNYVIKVMEIVLMAAVLFHVIITVWLAITNKMSRPVAYHHTSRTKTHTGSKLMIWTGILIFVALGVHFCDFYFVKLGFVEGKYMYKSEAMIKQLQSPATQDSEELRGALTIAQYAAQSEMTPEDFVENSLNEFNMQLTMGDSANAQMIAAQIAQLEQMKQFVPLASAIDFEAISSAKYVHNLNVEQKEAIEAALPELEVEPDFYFQAREKFHNIIMVIFYLVFFVVLWFHLRHAFASAFQTLGLNNYKYNKAIEVCALLYACLICLGFAAVPVLVFMGL